MKVRPCLIEQLTDKIIKCMSTEESANKLPENDGLYQLNKCKYSQIIDFTSEWKIICQHDKKMDFVDSILKFIQNQFEG